MRRDTDYAPSVYWREVAITRCSVLIGIDHFYSWGVGGTEPPHQKTTSREYARGHASPPNPPHLCYYQSTKGTYVIRLTQGFKKPETTTEENTVQTQTSLCVYVWQNFTHIQT